MLNIILRAGQAAILGTLLLHDARAQNAVPADRNAVNSAARPGGMMADSPVRFPKEGALPSKYPPDVPERSEPVEQAYFLFSTPCRSPAQIDRIQAEMPKGEFTAPAGDWEPLARTRRILTDGGELRLMAVGDSIVNDTMRSGWVAKLQEAYPKAKINALVYVRGGGGCQHYKEEGRVAKYILPRKPNLVYIGGISQKDIASIREVIHQLRAGLPEAEILLATGSFGTADPRDAAALAAAPHSGTGAYGQALKELAGAEHCAYLDMTTPWAEYIRSAKVHPHLFYRDVVHANEHGEQILAKIMMAFWTAPERPKAASLPRRVQHQDGRYAFRNDRYEAVINPHGRLESLKVEGEEFLSPPTVHANAFAGGCSGCEKRAPGSDLSHRRGKRVPGQWPVRLNQVDAGP